MDDVQIETRSSEVTAQALKDGQDEKSEFHKNRDRLVLELFQQWLKSGVVFEVYDDVTHYDHSTRSRATHRKPSIEMVETLGEWMELATGTELPTFCSGHGMRAETWQDKLEEDIESLVDDYIYEGMSEIFQVDEDEDDQPLWHQEVVGDIRSRLLGELIGCPEIDERMGGYGYLDKLARLAPMDFFKQVDPQTALEFPFLRKLNHSRKLDANLPDAVNDTTRPRF